jgi:hypothetical protein
MNIFSSFVSFLYENVIGCQNICSRDLTGRLGRKETYDYFGQRIFSQTSWK